MFRTVRHWWSDGSGQHTARLFAFEFLVVVAGVLVAQGLSNYAQHRADFAQMEEERARVRYEMETAYSLNESWNRAIPCLNKRLTDVMMGSALTSAELRRPSMPTPNYSPPDREALNLMERTYGVAEKNLMKAATDNIQSLSMRDEFIVSSWGRLMLLDPANGPISPEDRLQARLAAADIKGHLRSMEVITSAGLEIYRGLGLRARNNDSPDTGPANSCAAIWKSRRIDPPLTTP
jgi:hypothetical protein